MKRTLTPRIAILIFTLLIGAEDAFGKKLKTFEQHAAELAGFLALKEDDLSTMSLSSRHYYDYADVEVRPRSEKYERGLFFDTERRLYWKFNRYGSQAIEQALLQFSDEKGLTKNKQFGLGTWRLDKGDSMVSLLESRDARRASTLVDKFESDRKTKRAVLSLEPPAFLLETTWVGSGSNHGTVTVARFDTADGLVRALHPRYREFLDRRYKADRGSDTERIIASLVAGAAITLLAKKVGSLIREGSLAAQGASAELSSEDAAPEVVSRTGESSTVPCVRSLKKGSLARTMIVTCGTGKERAYRLTDRGNWEVAGGVSAIPSAGRFPTIQEAAVNFCNCR